MFDALLCKIHRLHLIRTGSPEVDREKYVRLEKAESDLLGLKQRAHVAISSLDSRNRRNHWQESIEQMIQGG